MRRAEVTESRFHRDLPESGIRRPAGSTAARYMYPCDILEHDDRDMMRPFFTMPAEVMPFMA